MMRILLFLATNLAVILVASLTLKLLGVDSYLAGSGLNYGSLLIFCAVFGFAGSFISLLLSKTMAKMSTRTRIIAQAQSADERWLLQTVGELAEKAGIGMPEVGVFPGPAGQRLCHRLESQQRSGCGECRPAAAFPTGGDPRRAGP